MNFAQLSLICLVAISGPALSLSKTARVPVVIGELAVGLILGATGFRVLQAGDPTFGFLADIGFALVMFMAGSHVPVRNPALKKGAVRGAARALGIAVVSIVLGIVVARAFHNSHAAMYAVLMASSSASLIMPSLEGVPLTGRSMVEVLPQLALADALCIVALPFAIDPAHVTRAVTGAVLVLAAAGAVFAVLRFVESRGYRRRVHRVSEERGLALELRVSLALLFGLAALALTAAAQLGVPVAGATTGTKLHLLALGEATAILLEAIIMIAVTTALSGRVSTLARAEAAAA
ncbi:cation:proton antiporter [Corynebacterium heidelbergense]|uniref:Sodium:proton antiporter n=1 Tax=Corynebacterium heidelbergense TaxID=2055947 RepID=A0A364VDR6_9CORY|nr:cation:proton antiporter [Corynebacterium heidelbergense]RAV34789.1 sodium:proton antiporter [Corynebacterium heidelbergense]WCZ37248.1 hypothetical protein CHEID_08590 [Corynebacterium heidelbergense]